MTGQFDLTKFVLSSDIRLNLIMLIYDGEDDIENISLKLNKSQGNVLRALNELAEKNLIEKINKKFSLTSFGYLISFNIKQLYDIYYSIEDNSDFWQDHDIDLIHPYFLKRLDIWKSAQLIEYTKFDLTRTFTSYAANISNSKNMNIILPFYANFYVELILNFLDKNKGTLRLVTNEEIWNSIQKNNDELCSKLIENNSLELDLTDQPIKLFFTVCDNFASLFLFLDEESFDDSSMLLIKDKKALKDALSVFNMCLSIFTQ